jgi:hydroxymethylbilane synthase
MKSLRIATRGSRLALIQAGQVREMLQKLRPQPDISIVEVFTKGDRDKSDFLHKSESVGFFTSEVEKAVLDGRADIAVHSLKDLPTAETAGLTIATIPPRESPADALICGGKAGSIAGLLPGATVGTSSLRRIAQVLHIRRDLKCVPLRGNVETRLRKVETGQIDAAIVACAGVHRLGLSEKIAAVLEPDEFIPAPAQGALAVQAKTEDAEGIELLRQIDDRETRITAETERLVLAALHGGCSIPLGVFCRTHGDMLEIHAMLSDTQGSQYIKLAKSCSREEAWVCARQLAEELLDRGGREILANLGKESGLGGHKPA